jgi:hypothetical protein
VALKAPPAKAPTFEQRWSVWGGAYGGSNRTSGDPAVVGSHDLAARAAGFAAGLEISSITSSARTREGIVDAGGDDAVAEHLPGFLECLVLAEAFGLGAESHFESLMRSSRKVARRWFSFGD